MGQLTIFMGLRSRLLSFVVRLFGEPQKTKANRCHKNHSDPIGNVPCDEIFFHTTSRHVNSTKVLKFQLSNVYQTGSAYVNI